LLYPDEYYASFKDIDLDHLREMGIKAVIIDIDNTLVPWSDKFPDENAYLWINRLRNEGFKVCLISNNTKGRVEEFNKDLSCYVIWKARKPLKFAYKKAIRYFNCSAKNIAVIGDQIFTDILGGNRLGMYTILVDPISDNEFFWTKFVRRIEKKFRDRARRTKDEKNK